MGDDDVTTYSDERRRLLGELELERKQLLRNIDFCRIRDISRPFIGEWSLKDIIGHIASWEHEVVDAFRELRRSQRPGLLDFDEARVEGWNREQAEHKRELDFVTAVDQLNSGRENLLQQIASLADEELAAEGSFYANLIHSTIAHDRDHWHEIAAKLAGAQGVRREASVISLPEEIARQI